MFDGSAYSHASLWTGEQVMEALDAGVTFRTLGESVSGAKYVDVYRFRDDRGRRLGGGLPAQPVLDRIEYYRAHHEEYAYDALALLAMISVTRRGTAILPSFAARLIRNFIDSAADWLQDAVHRGKQPMICSELVYRCFVEAGADYFIPIRGADIASISGIGSAPIMNMAESPDALAENAELDRAGRAFMERYLAARESITSDATTSAIYAPASANAAPQKAGRRKKARTTSAKSRSIIVAPDPGLNMPVTGGGGIATVAAVPDYVTPRDLSLTPYLNFVGTLRR